MSVIEITDDRKRIKVAASKGQLEDIVELSTKFSSDVKLLSETLIESSKEGHLAVVKWMVENTAADINYKGVIKLTTPWKDEVDAFHTPLTAACDYEHLDVVKYLVETSRIDVNLPDNKYGHTPLVQACLRDRVSVSMYLLNEVSEIDVNIAEKRGYTALHFAVSCSRYNDYTQLHLACMKGDMTEVMRLACVAQHLINLQSNVGYSPLHYACRFGHRDIVIRLMLEAADETITDLDGKTPAQLAEERGHKSLVNLLDRLTLWEEIQPKKWSINFLVMLTLRQMRLKL